MSTGFDDGFDWKKGVPTGTADGGDWTTDGGGAAVADALDFVIPSFSAATDVEQTEAEAEESKFASPPPGNYLFEITGFLKPPEQVHKTGYVGNQAVNYSPYKVALKLRVVGSPNLSMLDNIELPPSSPQEVGYFQMATKSPNGDRRFAGFMNKKLEHLIKRLGFPVVAGQPIPPEAMGLRNWVGRRVYATVTMGKPQIDPRTNRPKEDPSTGMPFPAKPQIELFSYREVEGGVPTRGQDGRAAQGQPMQAGQQAPTQAPQYQGHPGPTPPAQPAQRPAPYPQQARQPAPAGVQPGTAAWATQGLNNV